MNGLSLFSNVGIGETYLSKLNINIKVANEIIKDRAMFYKHLYKDCEMIIGDILNKNIYNEIIQKSKENNCKFLLATPPCQGMSTAGMMKKDDERNLLIIPVINAIKDLDIDYCLIENVIGIYKTKIIINNIEWIISDYIINELKDNYNIKKLIVDAADYGTPQTRKRAIILIYKKNLIWHEPGKTRKNICYRCHWTLT